MKTLSRLLFLIPTLFLLTNACAASLEQKGEPYMVKEFTMDGPGNLKVQTSGGSIDVASHQSNTVRVEMHVRVGNKRNPSEEAIREALEDYEIDISKTSNTVSAIASRNSSMSGWFGNSNNTSVSFTVYVPQSISCNLNTSGGSISLAGVKGLQDVKTSGGSLTLQRIDGEMNARTSGGSIRVENYSGVLDAHTSGGSIKLNDARGLLSVYTSGGSITLDNVSGSVEAKTSGGGINANLVALDKHLTLKTSGGSITATIPEGLGLDLDLKGNRVNTRLMNFNGEAEKDRIIGSMNGGGIPVVMSTSGGSVNLQYQ